MLSAEASSLPFAVISIPFSRRDRPMRKAEELECGGDDSRLFLTLLYIKYSNILVGLLQYVVVMEEIFTVSFWSGAKPIQ